MNYSSPERLEALAAAYVLGTLRGAARARFERVCAAQPAAAEAVRRWEDRWLAQSLSQPAVAPRADSWSRIAARIGLPAQAPQPAPALRWRTGRLLAAAAVAALVLAIGLRMRNDYVVPQVVAVLGTDAGHPLWQVEHPKRFTALTIRAVGAAGAPPGRSYELWALPRGGKPVSLGLLPAAGSVSRPLGAEQLVALGAADKLAVSIEPPGGSTTGAPTGPVVIVQAI